MSVPDRLRAADLRPLWTELHRRFCTGVQVSRVTLKDLDDAQRAALADLLGMDRYPPATVSLSVARLDAVLLEISGSDTRTVTEEIRGPIGDRARDRREQERERDELWAWLERHPVVAAEPALLGWVADVRRQGLVSASVPATRALLEKALRVLAALPSDGRPLASFATDVLGDSHALDDGHRLTGLVLRALAALQGAAPPGDAQERRALWQDAGVECDALSTTVLVAGLRPPGRGVLAQTLRLWADAGQASVVTLQQLSDSPDLRLDVPDVRVTENPTVLALALRRFGDRCPPLVCSSGWPNSAVIRLLRTIGRAGTALHYHGDFDGEGLRIAAYVMAKTQARPWRMSSSDYKAALDVTPGPHPSPGRVTEAPWDGGLAQALTASGAAILEEAVADALLADLGATSPGS